MDDCGKFYNSIALMGTGGYLHYLHHEERTLIRDLEDNDNHKPARNFRT